jgi:uncharacterized membrane protein
MPLQPSLHSRRYDTVDALRGVAMVWMTVFHFCFDLNHFRFITQDFYSNPLWTGQRTAIVSLFLFCAGLGQAIAVAQGQSWPRFWRRWAQVAGAALLVSVGSYLVFPRSFIYFGVLHGIAVMLLVMRFSAHWRPLAWWLLGAGAIALPWLLPPLLQTWGLADAFNARSLNWLGLVTRKPITEDYVPLLPWLGVMWWGMAVGHWLSRRRSYLLALPLPAPGRALAWLGRWSLSYYLLHQPVLMGVLGGVAALR